MIVYLTTNLINGKIYVGKYTGTKSTYLGSGLYFKRALAKYGRENFIRETLEYCSTLKELNEREVYWIERTKARDLSRGYNLAEGGEHWMLGVKHTDETKRKIGLKSKGNKNMLGKHHTNSRWFYMEIKG